MTNMPAEPAPFWPFAVATAAICVPFFSLIGFLSTNFGYRIWAAKTKALYRWLRPKDKKKAAAAADDTAEFHANGVNRTMSTEEGMRMRMGQSRERGREGSGTEMRLRRMSHRDKARERESISHPHIRKMVEKMGEGRESGLVRMGTVVGSEAENGTTSKDTVIDVKDK